MPYKQQLKLFNLSKSPHKLSKNLLIFVVLIVHKTILSEIHTPSDLRQLDSVQLYQVCSELRARIIDVMSKNPGHLGASLGAVELATGIHYVFNTPIDKLVWDVGHQSYAHKILTGRNQDFDNIRQYHGISGFPKMEESEFDDFGTGHSSTSISAVLGMALANQIAHKNNLHIAVIGDGSLTGGMSFEALNHLATTQANVLVIINDNDMSIDPNVGGLQNHLNNIDSQSNIFTNLGLRYDGPFNGNDITEVVAQLSKQQDQNGPRVLHFKTRKGHGYNHSEKGNATHWHAPGKFSIETGQVLSGVNSYPKTYQHIVGQSLCELANQNKNVVVITPAMASGSKLKDFEVQFPDRFFDVGISEQHAVTLSAGFATQGILPFCVIYSTFLQRGYDQLIHDVALQNLKVVFLIDRAGLVGNDGATHQGAFDMAFLNCIPNITIYTPSDEEVLHQIINEIPAKIVGPVAIRYPRGMGVKMEEVSSNGNFQPIKEFAKQSHKIAVISIGGITNNVEKSVQLLKLDNLDVNHFALHQVKPLPEKELHAIFSKYESIFIVEDGVQKGGIGEHIIAWAHSNKLTNKVKNLGFPDHFIEHGSPDQLYDAIGMSPEKIATWILA